MATHINYNGSEKVSYQYSNQTKEPSPLSANLANIGGKLNYLFGKATGAMHNIQRSLSMERILNKIGIFDNSAGRSLVSKALQEVLNSSKGVVQSNGRTLRDSLLIGPQGVAKMQTIWEGNKLITVEVFLSSWTSIK